MTARHSASRQTGENLSHQARAVCAAMTVAGVILLLAAGNALSRCAPGPVASEFANAVQGGEPPSSTQDAEGGGERFGGGQEGASGGVKESPGDAVGGLSGSSDGGSPAEGALDAVRDVMTARDPAVDGVAPEGFAEELFSVEGFEEVRVSDGGDVVGFLLRDSAEEAFAALKGRLEANGWAFVESGIENAGSFAKSGGVYQSCFLSCTEVAGSTAVVVQCPHGDAGSDASR